MEIDSDGPRTAPEDERVREKMQCWACHGTGCAPSYQSSAPPPSCQVCRGDGWLYNDWMPALTADSELDGLSWNPTAEEADAYLRGEGVIKKCEVCGQDATLTNSFVTHLMKRHSEVAHERDVLRAENERLKALVYVPKILDDDAELTYADYSASLLSRFIETKARVAELEEALERANERAERFERDAVALNRALYQD